MSGDIVVKTKLGEYLIKEGLLYTETDEWIKVEGETITMGITDYAQKKLKYIVNVELPEQGAKVSKGEAVVTLESVKSVADVYSPVDGEVVEVNEELLDSPDLINKDPYGKGWVLKIKSSSSIDTSQFLTPSAYAEKVKKEEQ
ncbi:MAG: glycine cleavage system protein GcvH [Desulfurococcales archaeon]|nr:glycine cleavage system protein GcvH [Desulfurococcales archaeon]